MIDGTKSRKHAHDRRSHNMHYEMLCQTLIDQS